MHRAMVYINDVVPDTIGFTTGAGLPGDIRFNFKTVAGLAYPDIDALYPQLVLRPFTSTGASAYDIAIDDVVGAAGTATIPGSVMNDRFNVEVYTRNSVGQPQAMIASGKIDLTGYAYLAYSPLSPAVATLGPMGPMGPQGPTGTSGPAGAAGMRGSRWYTGLGPPGMVADDRIEGDMYLDENNGNVYRWYAGTWTTFTGVGP